MHFVYKHAFWGNLELRNKGFFPFSDEESWPFLSVFPHSFASPPYHPTCCSAGTYQLAAMEAIFDDPVTFEVMKDAVVSSCGHSFSMASIAQWLETHDTCPICNHTLRKEDCIPNYALRNAIDQVCWILYVIWPPLMVVKYVSTTAPPTPVSPPPEASSSSLHRININAILNYEPELSCSIIEPQHFLSPITIPYNKIFISPCKPTPFQIDTFTRCTNLLHHFSVNL